MDFELPTGISKRIKIETTDFMTIYGIHRMRRTDPNYLQMTYKKMKIASFYTGYSNSHYVGGLDSVLTVILSEDDVLPLEFEGMMRAFANDVLSIKDSKLFNLKFMDYYKKLRIGEIEPYWFEQKKGKEVQINETAVSDEFIEVSMDDINFEDYFEYFKEDVMKARIKKMRSTIKKQEEIIDKLQSTINEDLSSKSGEIKKIHSLLDEIDALSEKYNRVLNENAKLKETIENLEEKIKNLKDN